MEEDRVEDNTVNPPAVLSVNPPPSPPSVGEGSREETIQSDEKDIPATIPGLSEMMNEWQISGVPEDQQFFSTSVRYLHYISCIVITGRSHNKLTRPFL